MVRAVLAAVLTAALPAIAQDSFIPVEGMVIVGSVEPTEAESLAVAHFNKEIARLTGASLPVAWGRAPEGTPLLHVGNRATLESDFVEHGWRLTAAVGDADVRNQALLVAAGEGAPAELYAAGFGEDRTARAFLGLGYALGELVKRLDVREGRWGFDMPAEPYIRFPETPNRTLYIMNSYNCSPGLSLEYFDEKELEDYVDFLIDAKYSRVNLWQWAQIYLYPGNNDEAREKNQMIHRAMRHLFDYARRRGLEIYHGLTPVHVNLEFLPDDPKFAGTGYYGRSGACWSQPEARELARNMARTEMEYYGPVDGYIVWFYDPGGCFCAECKPNQAKNIFEQLRMVEELAETISPDAKFQAVLWPTWIWHHYQDQGIPFTKDEADAMVREFLGLALDHFGPRNLTILDSCEADNTNIYNGLVKPEEFQRSAFMYSVLGMASEHGYPFAPFKFEYLHDKMTLAGERDLEDGNLFIQYAATNMPGVYTFADVLYGPAESWEDRMEAYVSTFAKGASFEPARELFRALEEAGEKRAYEDRDKAIAKAEAAWERVEAAPNFYGDKDWLKGYVHAQRHYLELARAEDNAAFQKQYAQFKEELGAIPMYSDYMAHAMKPELCVNLHLKAYWRGPGEDYRMVGLPEGQ